MLILSPISPVQYVEKETYRTARHEYRERNTRALGPRSLKVQIAELKNGMKSRSFITPREAQDKKRYATVRDTCGSKGGRYS